MIRAQGLTRAYRLGPHEVRALAGVDLEVSAGEFLAVMGRSGSGKSTLLNLIGCLDHPTSGQVYLDGVEVGHLSDAQRTKIRRDRVGFVFQQFNLIPTLTALENVTLPLRYAGVALNLRRSRAQEALEAVGLEVRLGHKPPELSGGEAQRVAIARALVNRPAVVLADEPTGELDSQTALEIIEMMLGLNRERGQTFILVTHDPMVAGRARRVVRLEDGRIVSDTGGSP